MKNLRLCIQIMLVVALVVIPTLTAFASGHSVGPSLPCRTSLPQGYGEHSAIPVESCCPVAQFSTNGISSIPVGFDPCCGVPSLSFGVGSAVPAAFDDCCEVFGSYALTQHNTMMASFVPALDPCDQTCDITIPPGSVVGDMPTNEQAYWAPGKISPDVIINAGTYWVTGEDKDDNGNEYYRILVACQYLWVPVDTMQPSYQSPWSGQPLPSFTAT